MLPFTKPRPRLAACSSSHGVVHLRGEPARENSAHAADFGITQTLIDHPPAPFAYFSSYLNPIDPEGSAHSTWTRRAVASLPAATTRTK